MKLNKLLLLFTIFLNSNYFVLADHLQGGEITWTCEGSGKYIFTVKLYRDCNGIPPPISTDIITNAPGFLAGIPCNMISIIDLSPSGPNCPTCPNPLGQSVAMNEIVYQSGLIDLVGVPPSTGWYFAYSTCCRSCCINNISNSSAISYVFRAIMYPYNGQNASPCFDSSPQFAEKPLLGAPIGSLVNYSHSAYDAEFDSLKYEWVPSLDGFSLPTATNCTYATGYSYNSPLPGFTQNNLNLAATLDSSTGMIKFLSYTQGRFFTVVKVTSYKCGIKTAEVYREISIELMYSLIAGNTFNTPPDLTSGLSIENYFLKVGDSLNLSIAASDIEMLPSSAGGGFQTVTLTHYGQNLGDGDTNSTLGCALPPCATMNPPTPITNQSSVASNFNFITDCSNLQINNECLQHQRKFSFTFNFKDNFCPANGSTSKIINVYVSGPEIQISGIDLTINYPNATYQWYLNGNPIVGATDSIFTPNQSGIYTAIVTTNGGCEMISNAFIFSPTGLNPLNKNDSFISIYPNPTEKGGMLNVVVNGIKSKENILQVLDINGRLIKQFNVQLNSESEHLVLDVSAILAGFYTLNFYNRNEIISEGFVIK